MLLWGQQGQGGVGQQTIYNPRTRTLTEPEQIPLHLLRLQLLEVAGIQIEIIRMILTIPFTLSGIVESKSFFLRIFSLFPFTFSSYPLPLSPPFSIPLALP
jgi:hypothetical protein